MFNFSFNFLIFAPSPVYFRDAFVVAGVPLDAPAINLVVSVVQRETDYGKRGGVKYSVNRLSCISSN